MSSTNPAAKQGGADVEGARTEARFRLLPTDRSPDEIEREMLELWRKENLFQQTLERPSPKGDFVFFEGPPTANGKPGIHHVFSRTVKDLFCRHRAMQGYHVARKAGWDTQGLAVEIEVEKQLGKELGLSSKQMIENIGVEKFNEMCRESVWKYRTDWEQLSERIGYWLDYSDPYVTYSNDYIESVWWALATLFEKGLLYRGHKVLPYCPRCETTLSSHEVAQGYRDVKDPSAYVALDLIDENGKGFSPRRRILVWTTTPWTLVSNVALAVNAGLEYVELKRKEGKTDESIILAEARVAGVLGEDHADRWEKIGSMKGSDLTRFTYKRPLDWVPYPPEGKHEIIVAEDFVSAEDGSGVVHLAPAFGADDYAAGKKNDLAFLQPVDLKGQFIAGMPLVEAKFFKEADAIILEELKRTGVLWKTTLFEHSYPHCWRCHTPLLYYARTSWFVRTTQYKDDMLARNSKMDWHPVEMREGRFGEWLTNNIDWAVSRDRYWGTPLPVWICDTDSLHVEAVGGYDDLKKRMGEARVAELKSSGAPVPGDEKFDPHKPFIDRISFKCSKCAGTMTRTTEVIDAWFDSGSMPFAQWHFPFENREKMERYYPADFIAEGVDQTRGWFYSLIAIATGLGDALPNNKVGAAGEAHLSSGPGRPDTAPYRSVVVNDLVLDAEGQKMSKHVGNIVEPGKVLPRHGADAVRLSLISSSQLWMPRRFDENGIRDTAGRFLLTLKNVYTGIFAEYANFGWSPGANDPAVSDRPLLDRWILARLATIEAEGDALLNDYDATMAVKLVMTFFDEDVSKWYVRLSRHRFYEVDGDDNRAAFATLHEVLTVTCRLLAPFAPFLTDWIHRELTGESVHLAEYRRSTAGERDEALERAMQDIRTLATLGRAAREEAGVKVRQPLSRVICVAPTQSGAAASQLSAVLEQLKPLLAAELNVKRVDFASSADDLVTLEAKANFRALGKRFGKSTPLAARSVEALKSETLRGFETGSPVYLSVDGENHQLLPEEVTLVRKASGDFVVQEGAGYFAAIDPALTEELKCEGLAREMVSRVQKMRKDSGFAVSDRIKLGLYGDSEVQDAVNQHGKWIADEVLALQLATGGIDDEKNATQSLDLEGRPVRVAIERVS
ncbi:MAG: isoleucine--tRNA ligase [Gemmatimonadaceae bacterium]|nr:isoleucine--tRNA ligase [Gemmatimonadaceae bacterium]